MARNRMIKRAVSLYRRFTGHEARYIDQFQLRQDTVLVKIGDLEGVMYKAKRDGKTETYLHRFSARARPILASSHDGKRLYIIGGKYDFTEDGIVG